MAQIKVMYRVSRADYRPPGRTAARTSPLYSFYGGMMVCVGYRLFEQPELPDGDP